jgi:hypothetical protein
MKCTICPIKTTDNFQYLNENCLCNLQKLDVSYSKFFGNGAIFLSDKVFENIKESINKLEKHIENKSPKVNGGILSSYDFHLIGDIPKLIEINTNAGGLFLNYKLLQLAKPCCGNTKVQDISNFEEKIVNMFRREFALKSGGKEELLTVAIMDENIQEQFLYPEILICKEILEKNEIQTFMVDSKDIEVKINTAYYKDVKIDLIYNRNTDFYFEKLDNKKFLEVLENTSTVISPSPQDHLVFANKKNLVALSQNINLSNIIPSTVLVTKENEKDLWSNKKKYFFKPLNSYGGKGSYNGKGLTLKVWEDILKSDYIAQEIVLPSIKKVMIESEKEIFKFDIRAYTYSGEILLLVARTYQGQTTNFRTKGGGFMPIFLTES